MFFSDKSDVICLAWSPRSHCFSKAQIEWNGLILNGAVAIDKPIVDLSSEDLNELVSDLFGSLGFIELCELHQALQSHKNVQEKIDWKLLFAKNQMSWNDRTLELINKLADCTPAFLDWAYDHKLSQQDLMPLNGLSNLQTFNDLSIHFFNLHLSRNDGKQAVDLLVDLLLFGLTPEKLTPQESLPWLQQLLQLRNPEATKAEQATETTSHWPRYVQVQKLRQGDRLMQKMQITYSDAKDLSDKLNRLSNMDLN